MTEDEIKKKNNDVATGSAVQKSQGEGPLLPSQSGEDGQMQESVVTRPWESFGDIAPKNWTGKTADGPETGNVPGSGNIQSPGNVQEAGNASRGFVPGQRMKSTEENLKELWPVKKNSLLPASQGQSTLPPYPGVEGDGQTPEPDDGTAYIRKVWNETRSKDQKSYDDMLAAMDRLEKYYKPKTEEELEKERMKRKRDQIFNAIGDGIQALSNLYFTTQYAPDSYDPKNSLTAKARERWDKIDKDRRGDMDKYLKVLLDKYKLNRDAGDRDMAWEKYFEELKAKREAAKAKAQAAEDEAKQKQENADRDYELKKDKAKADADYKKAMAKAATTRAAKAGSGRGGSGGSGSGKYAEFVGFDRNGNAHYFHNAKAAEQFSRREGTWTEGKSTSTTGKGFKNGKLETSVSKTQGGGYSKRPVKKTTQAAKTASTSTKAKKNIKGFGGSK